jgi:predicted CoA-binding protein
MIDDPIHGSDATVERILSTSRTWAVVGCSPDPSRTSHSIATYLLQQGYEVVPVHPGASSVLGRTCYPVLSSIPDDVEIDVVDLFRRSEQVAPHVDEAIAVSAKAIWMQLGVVDLAAAEKARAAGLDVVMDRCPRIEIPRRPR